MVAYAPGANNVVDSFEQWKAIGYGGTFPSVGGLFSSGTIPERSNAKAMDGSRRIYPGPISMHGSLIVSSM